MGKHDGKLKLSKRKTREENRKILKSILKEHFRTEGKVYRENNTENYSALNMLSEQLGQSGESESFNNFNQFLNDCKRCGWAAYDNYLYSDYWKCFRRMAIRNSGFCCQVMKLLVMFKFYALIATKRNTINETTKETTKRKEIQS